MKRAIILGSGSPRRKEILSGMGYDYEIMTASVDESCADKSPEKRVCILSERKALAVWNLLSEKEQSEKLVIGADTLVSDPDGYILGKPSDREDAKVMLKSLSGRTHSVYTGVTLIYKEEQLVKIITFADKTDVTFYPMTSDEIEWYVQTGECDDKAGAYAVQGLCMRFIEKLEGDYHNVVGLPAAKLYQTFKNLKLS